MARPVVGQRRGFGLMLLAAQIFQIGTDRIPPITLATVILNVAIYLRLIPFLPSVHGACTSNNLVLSKNQWLRLVYSSFYHLDDMHLYFNMVSFIWKGITLERKLKSRMFLILLVTFSILTQVTMLLINQIFAEIFSKPQYLYSCAAGFSAVCFALKVLTTADSDNNVSVMGMPITVPSRYACWVELILIQILVPNASFTGHLAGILVGLMYTHGPLSKILRTIDLIFSVFTDHSHRFSFERTARDTGRTGATPNRRQYKGDDDDDEQLQRAISDSLQQTRFQQQTRPQPPPYGWNIPQDNPPTYKNKLYPNLTNEESTSHTPSAPPYVNDRHSSPHNPYYTAEENNQLPYPVNTPPYPMSDILPRVPLHSSENPGNAATSDSKEDVRSARLRRFDRK